MLTWSGGDFNICLTVDGVRRRRRHRRQVQLQMLQVAVVPRHFSVDAAAALDQVTAHQKGVIVLKRRPIALTPR